MRPVGNRRLLPHEGVLDQMRRRPVTGVVALGASLALTLAACGGTDTSSQSGNGSGTTPAYNAGVDKIFNQSSTDQPSMLSMRSLTNFVSLSG
jgi:uncharacterized lipoprotein YehR (DUF1307 family)